MVVGMILGAIVIGVVLGTLLGYTFFDPGRAVPLWIVLYLLFTQTKLILQIVAGVCLVLAVIFVLLGLLDHFLNEDTGDRQPVPDPNPAPPNPPDPEPAPEPEPERQPPRPNRDWEITPDLDTNTL